MRATKNAAVDSAARTDVPAARGAHANVDLALRLHAELGNRVVVDLLRASSPPDDAAERDADRAADSVLRGDCAGACSGRGSPPPPPSAPASPSPPTPPGERLESSTRAWMEQRFRTGLGDVRVHAGHDAARSAAALGAEAYAVGRHIVFGRDRYAPSTPAGKHLLAHEIAHVLDHRNGGGAWALRRQTIGMTNDALNRLTGCRVADPAACPTYEGWIASFRHVPMFAARDTAPDAGASEVCYDVFPTLDERARGQATPHVACVPVAHPREARAVEAGRQRRGRSPPTPHPTRWPTLGDAPAAQQASPRLDVTDAAEVVGRFIDHPTDAWVQANLPPELHATAYGLPADCADIAVILRHVWLVAHNRSERYRGWVVGFFPGESRPRRIARIARVRASLNTPDIHQMVNAYTDVAGRPIRSFAALQALLHPGDVLVWAHHHGDDPNRGRSGGHTHTVLDVFWQEGRVTQIWALAGNQPIGPTQAADVQRYLGRRGLTGALRFTGGARVDVQFLTDQPLDRKLGDVMVGGEPVWTWSDGTTLVAAGPPAGAVRRDQRRRGHPTLGGPEDWIAEMGRASAGTLLGTFEAALASIRARFELGHGVSAAALDQLGDAASARLVALAGARGSSVDRTAVLAEMLAALEGFRGTTQIRAPVTADQIAAAFERLAAALRRSASVEAPAGTAMPEHGDALHAGVVRWGRPPRVPPLGVTVPPWSASLQGGRFVYPDLPLAASQVGGEWVVRVGTTTSADAVHPSVALPAGAHHFGREPITDMHGVVQQYDRYLIVTSPIADRIRAGEQEHLDDLELAYELSLEVAATAVNAVAGQEFRGPTREIAEAHARFAAMRGLPARLGTTPAEWRNAVKDLGMLSGERDRAGWHLFNADPETVNHPARAVMYRVVSTEASIGVIAPSVLVRYENLPEVPVFQWPSERHARSERGTAPFVV